MLRNSDGQRTFTRRIAILGGSKVLLLAGLFGRLYYLQVVESDSYATLAEENRISLRLLPPPRGLIVDRFGRRLAENRENFRVLVVGEQTHDLDATLDALGKIISVGDHDRRRIRREVEHKRRFVPVTVRENLSWAEMARIEVNSPDLPGVQIDVGHSRWYPYGAEMAHILGYVAAVSEAEQTGDPLLQLPGFRVGKAGVEKVYDLALRGRGGTSQVEVNAVGRVIKEIERKAGQSGVELVLTLDRDFQRFVAQRIARQSGSAVVMDVHSGDILAMASSPGFDPNSFNHGLSNEEWRKLVRDPRAPLTSRAIAGQYAPGSTYKMVVALAALEKGAITSNTEVFCPGHTILGTAKFHCWKKNGHGTVNLHDAITESCDVFFYEVAKRVGVNAISAVAKRLGMGQKSGIDLPNEKPGLVPTTAWKEENIGIPWQLGETLISGIGQGYILVTPLQLAVMTARLANGGKSVSPRVTRGRVKGAAISVRASPKPTDLGFQPRHINLILNAMDAVVNGPAGTARSSAILEEGMRMGGKTGTVQVRRISKHERETEVRKNEDLLWEERDHSLFVGFAPVYAPRYAVAIVIEHGGSGSKVAAPIGRDILYEAQRLDLVGVTTELAPLEEVF